jgi:hypothetical protein|tara:strand:- start:144 stop:260 length:117 start_codon:yes stop_codon:yes gene_type:complete
MAVVVLIEVEQVVEAVEAVPEVREALARKKNMPFKFSP